MIFEKIREKVSEYFKGKLIKDSWDIVQFNSDIISIVNQVQNEYNNGWINVDERLPETDDDILIILNRERDGSKTNTKCYICWYSRAESYFYLRDMNEAYTTFDVKYWQPLPEIYTPKGE